MTLDDIHKIELEDSKLVYKGPLLSFPKAGLDTIAASAIRSYHLASHKIGLFDGQITLNYPGILALSHVYDEHHPHAMAHVAVGNRHTQRATLFTAFKDMSVLVWRQCHKDENLFNLFPFPLKLSKKAQPLASAEGKINFVDIKAPKAALVFAQDKKRNYPITGVNPEQLPLDAQCIYAQIVLEAQKWADKIKTLPEINTQHHDKDLDPNGSWFIPPALPWDGPLKEKEEEVLAHFEKAANLIHFHLHQKLSYWGGSINARTRTNHFKHTPLDFNIMVLDPLHQKDKDVIARIERAFVAAAKHPSCPIPYAQLMSRDTVWAHKKGKVDKTRTHLLGTRLWAGRFESNEHIGGHKLMSASAHFGGVDVLFP
jgi:hypothetical protein